MKWFLGLLLFALVALQFQLWISADGARATLQLNHAIKEQTNENQRLHIQNDVLSAEIEDLKHGLDAVEERARTDLGMIRNEETFVQFVGSSEE